MLLVVYHFKHQISCKNEIGKSAKIQWDFWIFNVLFYQRDFIQQQMITAKTNTFFAAF